MKHPSPKSVSEYHVFLASPGDMEEERQTVRDFFNEYNKTTARHLTLRFEVVDWENYSSVGAGRAQELITKQTLERVKESLALVIGIMGQRFGSKTGKFESGTEEEFKWALACRKEHGWPEIKWFFKDIPQFRAPSDVTNLDYAVNQWKKVKAFKEKVKKPGSGQLYYKDFAEGKFLTALSHDLTSWLNDPERPWMKERINPSSNVLRKNALSTPQAHFRRFLDRSRLFNHAWSLVGRGDTLTFLNNFVGDESTRVALLTGRPGMGKSKILYEFSQLFKNKHPGKSIYFLSENTPTSEIDDEFLNDPAVTIAVDDAHLFPDLQELFTRVPRENSANFILATRQYRVSQIKSDLAYASMELRYIVEAPVVTELSRADVKILAEQALGQKFKKFADQVTTATRDCPLITVIAGRLLADNSVRPQLLSNNKEFHHIVMSRFEDEIIGEITNHIPPEQCKRILRLIAAAGPITPADAAFVNKAAEFLQTTKPELREALGFLEAGGILLRRGRRVRITPDALAEHILMQACFADNGTSTGYGDEVYAQFRGVCPNILLNLAEADWRRGHG